MTCIQIKTVEIMWTQNPANALQKRLPLLIAALACIVLFTAPGSATAQPHVNPNLVAQLMANPVSEPRVQEQSSSPDEVPASNGNPDTTSSSGDSDDGVLSMLFSGYGLFAFFVLLLAALFVIKKIRAKRELDEAGFEPEPQQPLRNQSPQTGRSHTRPVKDRTGTQHK